jgi:multicomponent Na+:H+ antiporter subunit F
MELLLHTILIILTICVFVILGRLVYGPSLPDRVISLDLLVTVTIGIIAVFSILNNKTIFIDVVLVLALLAFLGTVAFAYYYEKGLKK